MSYCEDNLFTVKLQIFIGVAKEVEPFLAKFQMDKPVLPFLWGDLLAVVQNPKDRFVKEDIMKTVGSSVSKLFLAAKDLTDPQTPGVFQNPLWVHCHQTFES